MRVAIERAAEQPGVPTCAAGWDPGMDALLAVDPLADSEIKDEVRLASLPRSPRWLSSSPTR